MSWIFFYFKRLYNYLFVWTLWWKLGKIYIKVLEVDTDNTWNRRTDATSRWILMRRPVTQNTNNVQMLYFLPFHYHLFWVQLILSFVQLGSPKVFVSDLNSFDKSLSIVGLLQYLDKVGAIFKHLHLCLDAAAELNRIWVKRGLRKIRKYLIIQDWKKKSVL